MKRAKLLKSKPCEMPKKKSDNVIAASQIIALGNERTLNIDLFYMGKLRGRYFANDTVYNTNVDGKWHTCKINNVARLCKGESPVTSDYYYCSKEWVWSTDDDKERAMNFLDTHSMDVYESGVNGVKRERALERKCKRIEEMMAEIPNVPEEAEEWIKDKVFPGNILFLKRKKARTTYHCTACGYHGWKKKGWKHGEKTICPKCGQPVTANSRQQEKMKKEPVVILQAYGQQWVERQFKAVCRWSITGKELSLYEQCRAIIPKNECWGKVYYGIYGEADEFEQDFWDKNQGNKRFLNSYLWPGNLQEVLQYGRLEGSGLDLVANDVRKLNVNKFITTFHKRPWMEYFAKAGLSQLVSDIVNIYGWWGNPKFICTSAQNLREALRLDGNRVYRMKQINGGLNALKWLQYEAKNGIKISQESLQYLSDKNVSISDCKEILEELKSVNRMVNYMKKQKIAPSKLTITWRDYLRMAKDEGMDTTDDIVRLPKDLKARHDYLVELGNARRDAEELKKNQKKYAWLDKKIMKRLPDAARYFWEDETYMIIPAGKCEELMIEGRKLHHCVGRNDYYMKKMASGTSWICFLRKKKNLEKPYYTLEIDMENDSVLQSYSEFDRRPDAATINGVLSKFKNDVKRKRKKEQVKAQKVNIA